MRRIGLKKKAKKKREPPAGMWAHKKNIMEVMEEFKKREKDIKYGDVKKRTEMAKSFLRDVYRFNPRQYFQVSSIILDEDAKFIIDKLKASKNFPLVEKEYNGIKSAMAKKEEISSGFDRWRHIQMMREMDGIGGEKEFLSQKRLTELRKCDRGILENMEMLAEKTEMFGKIVKKEKEKIQRYIG